MRFAYRAVERLPKQLSAGVIYHSEEFEVAALLCACGCGHRVTLLVPDSHRVSADGGWATVRPSIAVCDAPCKSHYVISAGEVEWLPAFSNATASSVMRKQIARHAAQDMQRRSFGKKVMAAIAAAFSRVRAAVKGIFG
ncbi:hypothetical protein M2322_004178 [Rhodoblastus acidophilus]|uniref:DUF6527 family protein n=1 Tax=Rhodoblastus acidophilus TaxID=1074 RepID=UPI0022242FAE|nr:DUF6527 family protein [Rhodoblastus acidophilus]MCW2318609.1 hypothetical protein [Rhodoblastus acidophilus]